MWTSTGLLSIQWANLFLYYTTDFHFVGFAHLCQQAGQQLRWAVRLSRPSCQLLASPGADWLGSGGFPLRWKAARWWRATAGILLLLAPNYNCLAVVQHASVFRQAAAAVITHPKLDINPLSQTSVLQLSGKKKKIKKTPRFFPNNICVLGMTMELI